MVVELVDAYRREHRVEDRELARGEASDHDAPRAEALRRELVEAHLRGDCAHARDHTATATSARFIHQREERVRRVGADCGEDASDKTGRTRDAELLARRHLRGLGAQATVDAVRYLVLDHKFRDGVPVCNQSVSPGLNSSLKKHTSNPKIQLKMQKRGS